MTQGQCHGPVVPLWQLGFVFPFLGLVAFAGASPKHLCNGNLPGSGNGQHRSTKAETTPPPPSIAPAWGVCFFVWFRFGLVLVFFP